MVAFGQSMKTKDRFSKSFNATGLFEQGIEGKASDMSVDTWVQDVRLSFQLRSDVWAGNIVEEQSKLYLALVRNPSMNISTVCETGFFKGVSTHLWLYARPNIVVHSFDIKVQKTFVKDLRNRFQGPERLFMYEGDSNLTIPTLPAATTCDLISIDGSHDGWQPFHDFVLLAKHARCDPAASPTYVVFDDTFDLPTGRSLGLLLVNNNPKSKDWFNWCSRSYWHAVSRGLIQHIKCIQFTKKYGNFPKGFCIGTVVAQCPEVHASTIS